MFYSFSCLNLILKSPQLTSKKNTPISLEVADMEDFGKPTSSPPKKPIRTQDKALSKASIVTPTKVLLNSESFFPWLDQRKKAWRNSRLKSRQPRIGISTNTKVDKKRKLANVQSYLQHQMDTVQASELHVVEGMRLNFLPYFFNYLPILFLYCSERNRHTRTISGLVRCSERICAS